MGNLLSFKYDKGQVLSEEQIADNVIGVLFAAQDTTASALTWIIKYLSDHKNLLEAVKVPQNLNKVTKKTYFESIHVNMKIFFLQVEQKVIQKLNGDSESSMTWNQTRDMKLTHKVI